MNPLDRYAEPDPCEPDTEFDPDVDRDRREAEAIEDAYDAWVDRQMGVCRREAS